MGNLHDLARRYAIRKCQTTVRQHTIEQGLREEAGAVFLIDTRADHDNHCWQERSYCCDSHSLLYYYPVCLLGLVLKLNKCSSVFCGEGC